MSQEPRFWVIVASRDHVSIGEEGGFAHASHGKASPLKRMSPGDWILFYSSKLRYEEKAPCKRFTAIARVKEGEVYQAEMPGGFKPFRRNVEFFPCYEIDILPLIPDLTFIRKKESWGYVFKFGFFEIPRTDFEFIAKTMIHDTSALPP